MNKPATLLTTNDAGRTQGTEAGAGAESARAIKLVHARGEADERYVGQTAVVKQVRITIGDSGNWAAVDFVAEFPNGAAKDVSLDDAEVAEYWPRR
jgi:hypothetical protein